MTITHYGLRARHDHLFLELPDGPWLLDTGAGHSLSRDGRPLTIGRATTPTRTHYLGTSLQGIQRLGKLPPFAGLIGLDQLLRHDILFDLPNERATFYDQPAAGFAGESWLKLDTSGIPTIWLTTQDGYQPWWLDSGAQLSYYRSRSWEQPDKHRGAAEDFFPSYGRYTTQTYDLDLPLNGAWATIRAGRLPRLLRAMLGFRTAGIIGQQLFRDRPIGFFPLQGQLVIGRQARAN